MTGRSSMHGRRTRTQQDHYQDAITFIYNARDHMVLAVTGAEVCARYGVKFGAARKRISEKLEERQAALRGS